MMRSQVLALILVACAGSQARHDDLMGALRVYSEGVRWKRFNDAVAFIKPLERERFLDARDELEDFLIDEYEIERVKFAKDKATVRMKYTWHLDSAGRVHDTWTEQNWERDGKSWLLVSEEHKRGEKMPGVDDDP